MNAPLPEHIRKALETVTLDDKYSLDYGRAFMSGVQALVKLPMLQRQRDGLVGKNTAENVKLLTNEGATRSAVLGAILALHAGWIGRDRSAHGHALASGSGGGCRRGGRSGHAGAQVRAEQRIHEIGGRIDAVAGVIGRRGAGAALRVRSVRVGGAEWRRDAEAALRGREPVGDFREGACRHPP